jgi:hypothetical protein
MTMKAGKGTRPGIRTRRIHVPVEEGAEGAVGAMNSQKGSLQKQQEVVIVPGALVVLTVLVQWQAAARAKPL